MEFTNTDITVDGQKKQMKSEVAFLIVAAILSLAGAVVALLTTKTDIFPQKSKVKYISLLAVCMLQFTLATNLCLLYE